MKGAYRVSKWRFRKITIKVTPQTAYNLEKLAKMERTYPGRVVDKLVRDRMLSFRRDGYGSD